MTRDADIDAIVAYPGTLRPIAHQSRIRSVPADRGS